METTNVNERSATDLGGPGAWRYGTMTPVFPGPRR
jgi:hypothetical protein